MQSIQDSRFEVVLDKAGSSPLPQTSIWYGQHQCVSESFVSGLETAPDENRCGQAIIKHQLKVEHFSVLNFAFVKLNCGGFPHSVVAQITRHRDSAFLVQSNRYSGDRFVEVAAGKLAVDDAFYLRPVGLYFDRAGNKFVYTEEERKQDLAECLMACKNYASKVARGCPYEMARGLIPYDFRQAFTIAGTLESTFHWLDQRSKADSQIEIQAFAVMAVEALSTYCPELINWYKENRMGRARLAP